MPRPVHLTRIHRTARPFMRHREWWYDPWLQFLWVWLRGCDNYDRHKWWREA